MDELARKAVKIEAQNAELIRKSTQRKRLETVTRVIDGCTRSGCGKKTKKGKHRKHTPITSEAQQGKFGAELARRRAGKARRMRGITTKELESHLEESKGKKLPAKAGTLKARKQQRNRRAG